MDEEKIAQTPKSIYKKEIWSLVRKAAFEYFMNLKANHTKLDKLTYTKLKLQDYLSSSLITHKQKELLYLLRSSCYNVKCNFKKLHRNNLACVLGCPQSEDQYHAFTQCQPIIDKIKNVDSLQYSNIFGPIHDQLEVVNTLYQIDQLRKHITKKHIPPGGSDCQDPCTFGYIPDGAANIISS